MDMEILIQGNEETLEYFVFAILFLGLHGRVGDIGVYDFITKSLRKGRNHLVAQFCMAVFPAAYAFD